MRSEGTTLGHIGRGAVVLVGVEAGDDAAVADRMADKVITLRYFEDERGKTNLDLAAVGGALLVVSQFTLLAELGGGRRPSFGRAAAPEIAAALVERFSQRLRLAGATVAEGRFGAMMEVELVNDGPFTLLLDSRRDLRSRPG